MTCAGYRPAQVDDIPPTREGLWNQNGVDRGPRFIGLVPVGVDDFFRLEIGSGRHLTMRETLT